MSKALQIERLKEIFKHLNPDVDINVIDFESHVDETLSLPENRIELSERFPAYRWFETPEERESVRVEAERKLKEDIEFLSFAVADLPPEAAETATDIIEAFEKRAESIARLRRRISSLRREVEEWKAKAEAAPPTVGIPVEEHLWGKFSAILRSQGLNPERFRSEYDSEYGTVKELPVETRQRVIEGLARDILIREKPPPPPRVAPPPAAPPPPAEVRPAVPAVAARMPRVRRIETFRCWVPGCPEMCVVDRDLEERVRMVPVMKAWTPRGTRYEPLLPLPPLFFLTCERHRYEKFGYRDIYDALAYLLAETRSHGRRLTVTKATLREAGLDEEDLREIQAREKLWVGRAE